jgi:glycerol-3-phosphate dehydrogenase (NAD(P)+)
MKVAVVGTTSWGTTLAVLAARGSGDVTLWARSVAEADELNAARENRRHRPGLAFPETLSVSADAEAIATAEVVVLAVPSAQLRSNLVRLAPAFDQEATVVSATKGIDPASGERMSEVIAEFGIEQERILALSGPNFAGEIAAGLPAATVVAGPDSERAQTVQALLSGPRFRVYTGDDIAGVEFGGALKNVVAIACGLSDGLGFGDNARAALITRALAEISRLGVAAGGKAITFLGLAGIGDLVLSCQSDLSRNRRLGLALAKGLSVNAAVESIVGVVEGAVTAKAVPALCKRYGVELPICEALRSVLYVGKPAAEAVGDLMARELKAEFGE